MTEDIILLSQMTSKLYILVRRLQLNPLSNSEDSHVRLRLQPIGACA